MDKKNTSETASRRNRTICLPFPRETWHMTAAEECILGVSAAKTAGEDALKGAYAIYKDEARNVTPDYSPETVNTDGWRAAVNAWRSLFPSAALILCFLHVFIGILDRAKKKFGEIYNEVAEKRNPASGDGRSFSVSPLQILILQTSTAD